MADLTPQQHAAFDRLTAALKRDPATMQLLALAFEAGVQAERERVATDGVPRPVTASEDDMLRNAAKASSKLVATGKLVDGDGVPPTGKVQLPEKARAGIEVLHRVVESLLTTSRYVDEEGEATQALADLSDCMADPPFRLRGTDGVMGAGKTPDGGQR